MRCAHRLTSGLASAALACVGAVALATPATAQSAGEARGMRYLSWTGRAEATTPAPATTSAEPTRRRDLRRPNTVIPHGGFGSPANVATAAAPRSTLTPANAWMRTRAPAAGSVPAPVSSSTAPPSPPPAQPVMPSPRLSPDYLPDQGGRGQSIPAEALSSAPPTAEVATPSPVDPMAPRRDAPIFRMQRDAAAPRPEAAPGPVAAVEPPPRAAPTLAATGDAGRPAQHGARYYSVHRQVGRRPDALERPEPGYIDALAIGQIETLASQDLAVPEQGPALIRGADGRMRAQPAASDGDHQ